MSAASVRRMRGDEHSTRVHLALALLLLSVLLAPLSASAQSSPSVTSSNWSPPRTVYIPDTGHTIDGIFLDHWRFNSGISNYGYPITPEFTMGDVIAQYYAYARFEYHPNAADGEIFKLGNIGEELRPMTVPRNSLASSGPGSAVAEVQLINRAWLPVAKKDAGKNTDAHVYVPATKHTVSNGFKVWWDVTGGDAFLGNPLTQEYVLKGTTYQVFERGQLAWTAENGVWLVPLGYTLAQQQQISTAPLAQGNIPAYSEELFVEPKPAGPKRGNGGERWIEVNLTTQYFIAWEGDVAVYETYTSTGRPEFATPPGSYRILTKLESQTMEGVLGGEYYNVPDVPWVQYFTNRGHAIHGAYWHNNFGTVMSHGCVNLPVEFSAWLYDWTEIGTRVEIRF